MGVTVGLILLALGALFALVAVMPERLRLAAASSMRKDQERMRATGGRNPYFGPDTDVERFLSQLRIIAAIAALLALGLAGVMLRA